MFTTGVYNGCMLGACYVQFHRSTTITIGTSAEQRPEFFWPIFYDFGLPPSPVTQHGSTATKKPMGSKIFLSDQLTAEEKVLRMGTSHAADLNFGLKPDKGSPPSHPKSPARGRAGVPRKKRFMASPKKQFVKPQWSPEKTQKKIRTKIPNKSRKKSLVTKQD